ncbi:hypothetical protein [uncultured Sphingomonas sp.]|uniref:hypothetical protein n=1 Tax=uncultured Sphingomonas sp. TaxID=158754 RepID=UPI0035CBFA7B
MPADKGDFRTHLKSMDEQLTSMIAIADDREDFLLGALLCEVHAYVERRYTELQAK